MGFLNTWKLEAIADMFSAISNYKDTELYYESYYGIVLLIREQAESMKESLDILPAYIHHIKNA
jgi:hypothetical protein